MSNLSIENLSHMVQVGDAEGILGGGQHGGQGMNISEARVANEMRANGMQAPEPAAGGAKPVEFLNVLSESLSQVNQNQVQADTAMKELVAGRSKNIHETMLTIERADASLKMMMQVRNKILDAYKEIMRMQV